jgi:hypothetical protein
MNCYRKQQAYIVIKHGNARIEHKKTMRLHIKALMMVLSEREDDITVFTHYIPKIVALVLDYTSRKIQLDQWRKDQEENGKNKVERPSLTINMDYIPFGVTLKYLYDHNAIADANMFFVDTKGRAVGNCQHCKCVYLMNLSRCYCRSTAQAIQYGFCIGDPASPSAKQVKFNPAFIAILFATRAFDIHPYAMVDSRSTPKRTRRGVRGPRFRQHSNLQKTTYLKEAGHWTPAMTGGMTMCLQRIADEVSLLEHLDPNKSVRIRKMIGFYRRMLTMVCDFNGELKQLNLGGEKPMEHMLRIFVEIDVVQQELRRYKLNTVST